MWKLIAAVDENWGIGRQDRLLVQIPRDMERFKERTMGQIVVMGRKTFESLPGRNPLKGRLNIVLTTQREYDAATAAVVHGVEGLRDYLDERRAGRQVYVMGGETVYRLLLPFCDEAYITKVREKYDSDTFCPDLDANREWNMVWESGNYAYSGVGYTFRTYHRNVSAG